MNLYSYLCQFQQTYIPLNTRIDSLRKNSGSLPPSSFFILIASDLHNLLLHPVMIQP